VAIKYKILKNAISKDLAEFCFNYFNIKRQVVYYLWDKNFIPNNVTMFGTLSDAQVPNTYSHYADLVMETLLLKCQKKLERLLKFKLQPAYSYARIYKKGDVLKKHKDRFSCELSVTLNLGGEIWPIYLKDKKEIKVNLQPGDMLFYYGCELEHWRNKFKGNNCTQVFLHYNRLTKSNKNNIYDGRPMIGLPSEFRNL
jgi:hypothetical protein|tara:strand:- start:1014 stop:1607 length:594 start_codon:yes stop_codon:yes gene_type:complete